MRIVGHHCSGKVRRVWRDNRLSKDSEGSDITGSNLLQTVQNKGEVRKLSCKFNDVTCGLDRTARIIEMAGVADLHAGDMGKGLMYISKHMVGWLVGGFKTLKEKT